MQRRNYLAILSALSAGSIAGCSTDSNDGNGGDNGNGGSDGNGGGDRDDSTGENGSQDETEPEGSEEGEGGNQTDQADYVNQADSQVQLTYGETARVSNGVEFTVNDIHLESSAGDVEPEERDLFAFAEVVGENTSDEEQVLPDATDPGIYLIYGNQQVEPVFNSRAHDEAGYEQYEGDSVQGGIRREGTILFEVDEGYEGEIDFLWQDDYFVASEVDGEIDVRWSNQ